jgi:ankyrin repeat protein
VVRYLADARPGALDQRTNHGWLPLHLAVAYRRLEAVRCLADACPGALVERTTDGWLPLHLAARYPNVDVVQSLANKCPGALKHVAARHAKSEVVEWLANTSWSALAKKTDCGRYPLHLAACRGGDHIVFLLAVAFPQALHEPAQAAGRRVQPGQDDGRGGGTRSYTSRRSNH